MGDQDIMRSLNKIMVIGNLGRDAEMRYLPSGKAVCNFSVAVNRTYTTAEGEQREEVEWFRVEAWERLAEVCGEYLKKGNRVYIEGRLRTREYVDRDDQKRTAVEIIANDMLMLEARDPHASGEPATRQSADEAVGESSDTDEMPF
jgi:single-strand DNA-binding protein